MNAYLGVDMYNGLVMVTQVAKPDKVFFLFSEENMWPLLNVRTVLNDTVLLTRYPPYTISDVSDTFGTFHYTNDSELTKGKANMVFIDGHGTALHVGNDVDKAFKLSWTKGSIP